MPTAATEITGNPGKWPLKGCVYACVCHVDFRIIGLCLLQNEICPLYLNRHVLKCLLGRKIGWHDLAFLDPVMYEGMRQLVHDAESKDFTSMFSALELTFAIDLSQEEVRLISDFIVVYLMFI